MNPDGNVRLAWATHGTARKVPNPPTCSKNFTGELFRVLVNYEFDEEGYCTAIVETFSERLN